VYYSAQLLGSLWNQRVKIRKQWWL